MERTEAAFAEQIFSRWGRDNLLRISVITTEPDDELSDMAICIAPIIGQFLTDVLRSPDAFARLCAAMLAITGEEYGILKDDEARHAKD